MSHKHSPIHPINVPGNVQAGLGMTLREHFAGLALAGILARSPYLTGAAKDAVVAADKLIEELNK